MHEVNSFVTLTYNEKNYPMHGSLNVRDYQLFAKRLRRTVGPHRFFMCGEYGEQMSRPHYHALLFGVDFVDKVKSNSIYSRSDVYESETLNRLWGKGFCTIGEVNYATARYVASYTLKKHNVRGVDDNFYRRCDPFTGDIVDLLPEFANMSLKPGIGLAWLERYWRDLYETGTNAVIVNGRKQKIPRYFDEQMRATREIFMESVDWDRERKALEHSENNTPERLRVREEVKKAEQRFNKERFL